VDSFGKTPLHIACTYGQISMVEQLLKVTFPHHFIVMISKIPFIYYICNLYTLLKRKDLSMQQNHSPVSKTKTGRTPLHEVCVGGHKLCLRTLLQYTPEVNIRDREGQTPAHVAAFNGELGCIKMLQDKGTVKLKYLELDETKEKFQDI
jgi:ankyrin repeat protein